MIKEFLSTSQAPFFRELRQSIKDIEVEERMDLLIHRPLGLLISRAAIRMALTPTQISLLSLLSGFVAGVFFYGYHAFPLALAAAFFLILSGLLDSADGQVARLTGRSSRLGMIIDGTIDYLVFVFAYAGCALALVPQHGGWIFFWAAVSGFGCHGPRSMIFEFQKNEMQYYWGGHDHYRNRTQAQARQEHGQARGVWQKGLTRFYVGYVANQQRLVTRKGEIRSALDALNADPERRSAFRRAYRQTYAPFLTGWALCGGTNTHRTLLMVFALLGRFEVFLAANFLLWIPAVILTRRQAAADVAFIREFDGRGKKGVPGR